MSDAGALVAMTAEGDASKLCAPAVGILRNIPPQGRILQPGEVLASLTILDRTHAVLVPEGVMGIVRSVEVDGSGADAVPVEYGQPILTLAPLDAAAAGASADPALAGAKKGKRAAGKEALPEGCHAVVSPADGIFYRKPRPADPPYVEAGASVTTGQTLGLIEAMKTFSPIPYGGPGLPSPATVVEIRAEDSADVRHGQVLFVVR